MSEMEQDVKDFLKRIVWSISTGLLYLTINSTAGIMYGLFFFESKPRLANYIFYCWVAASTAVLLWLLHKWWKKKFPHG
jgi:oligoribonuclease (3'-5' exoribonuclease)